MPQVSKSENPTKTVHLSAEVMMGLGVRNTGKNRLSGDISQTSRGDYTLGYTYRAWSDGHVVETYGRRLADDEVPGILRKLRLNAKLNRIRAR